MKKKYFLPLLILALVLILIPNEAKASQQIRIWMNGSYITTDADPFIENGRTLVPVRVITENLGYTVNWDGDNQLVSIYSVDLNSPQAKVTKYLMLGIDDKEAHILNPDFVNKINVDTAFKITDTEYSSNVTIKTLDVAPKLSNARTFVPIRFIAEEFNVAVDWDQDNWTVIIGDRSSYVPTPLNNTITPLVGAAAGVVNTGGSGGYGGNGDQGEVPVDGAKYIANTNTFKFHYSWCSSVDDMNESHKAGYNRRESAVNNGYIPCKRCNP